ncbi:MAG: hypothetical protein DMF82_24165 [Acidobacteria bacterium]|nr:MAG: hypothetical protein DMF82_24165 [Acidobacteriota bacterium]
MGISLAALMLAPSAYAARPVPAAASDFVPDEVLVSFRPGANVDESARAVGARVHRLLDQLRVHVLKVRPGMVPRAVAALSRNPLVEFAEPNIYLHAFPNPDDPYDDSVCYDSSDGACVTQWAWAKVNVRASRDRGHGPRRG